VPHSRPLPAYPIAGVSRIVIALFLLPLYKKKSPSVIQICRLLR
jgi:hypothetical protein